jgi:hypothetical protein
MGRGCAPELKGQRLPDQERIGGRIIRVDGAGLAWQADAVRCGPATRVRFRVAGLQGGEQLHALRIEAGAARDSGERPVSSDDRDRSRKREPEMKPARRWGQSRTTAGHFRHPDQGQDSRVIPCPDRGAVAVII